MMTTTMPRTASPPQRRRLVQTTNLPEDRPWNNRITVNHKQTELNFFKPLDRTTMMTTVKTKTRIGNRRRLFDMELWSLAIRLCRLIRTVEQNGRVIGMKRLKFAIGEMVGFFFQMKRSQVVSKWVVDFMFFEVFFLNWGDFVFSQTIKHKNVSVVLLFSLSVSLFFSVPTSFRSRVNECP